jgi:hypothetical protein
MKILKFLIFPAAFLITTTANAQWALDGGIGIATPLTCYSEMVGAGSILQVSIAKKLVEERLGVGVTLAWARMHNDYSDHDKFQNIRIDQVPIFAFADYELIRGKWIPYAGLMALHRALPELPRQPDILE